MRTFLQMLLNRAEVTRRDANMLCLDFVRREDEGAECIRTTQDFVVKSGRRILGRGKTTDEAWEDAAYNLMN